MKKLMKRLAALITAILTLCACAALAETAGIANPWTELDSLEALNEAADVNLCLPPVMGVTDVSFRLMRGEEMTLAEVRFKVNGTPYTFRASGVMDQDISGVYINGDTAFAGKEAESVVIEGPYKLARWLDIGGQYVLMAEDDAMSPETFKGIADEMRSLTNPFRPEPIAGGVYEDEFSQRAYAEVTVLGENLYRILVHWSSAWNEADEWEMTASVAEDGLLTYSDCVKSLITAAEDGSMTAVPANLIPEGYFEVVDGKLLWTGAAEKDCRDCVFALSSPAE